MQHTKVGLLIFVVGGYVTLLTFFSMSANEATGVSAVTKNIFAWDGGLRYDPDWNNATLDINIVNSTVTNEAVVNMYSNPVSLNKEGLLVVFILVAVHLLFGMTHLFFVLFRSKAAAESTIRQQGAGSFRAWSEVAYQAACLGISFVFTGCWFLFFNARHFFVSMLFLAVACVACFRYMHWTSLGELRHNYKVTPHWSDVLLRDAATGSLAALLLFLLASTFRIYSKLNGNEHHPDDMTGGAISLMIIVACMQSITRPNPGFILMNTIINIFLAYNLHDNQYSAAWLYALMACVLPFGFAGISKFLSQLQECLRSAYQAAATEYGGDGVADMEIDQEEFGGELSRGRRR